MNNDERKEFWDTLVSLKGEDPNSEVELLKKTITRPKYLYRYRTVTSNSLAALRDNKLYFSSSDYYDDPFDTFVNIDIKGLKNQIKLLQNPNVDIKKIINEMSNSLGIIMPNDLMEFGISQLQERIINPIFCESILDFVRNIRNEIKKSIWSVCFSENGVNEVLWLKYAEQHKGFAVRYDLENDELFRCGKDEKCKECVSLKAGASLYPICYSHDMYDGTRFGQFMVIAKALQLNYESQVELQRRMGISNWDTIKISTIKKECHRYDEEWRLISNAMVVKPVCQKWIPGAIVLGLNMNERDRILVSTLAKDAGIKKLYQCIINDEGTLEMEEL